MSSKTNKALKLDMGPAPRNYWELLVTLGGLMVFLGLIAFVLNFFTFSIDGDAINRSDSQWFLPIGAASVFVWVFGMLVYLVGRVGKSVAR